MDYVALTSLQDSHSSAMARSLIVNALADMYSARTLIDEAVAALPVLTTEMMAGVDLEEPCPICFVPLSALFTEEKEAAEKTESGKGEGKSDAEEVFGVTKVEACGHVFCRRDLTEWIRSQHGSCPSCRHAFITFPVTTAVDDTEDEDEDDYVPDQDDFEDEFEDEDDDFEATTSLYDSGDTWLDNVFNANVDMEDWEGNSMMVGDPEMDEADEGEFESDGGDIGESWGLTDGESMSSSEAGDISLADSAAAVASANVLDREISVSVHESEDLDAEDEGINVGSDTPTPGVAHQTKIAPSP